MNAQLEEILTLSLRKIYDQLKKTFDAQLEEISTLSLRKFYVQLEKILMLSFKKIDAQLQKNFNAQLEKNFNFSFFKVITIGFRQILAGIGSFGLDFCTVQTPPIFTNLINHLGFINDTITGAPPADPNKCNCVCNCFTCPPKPDPAKKKKKVSSFWRK